MALSEWVCRTCRLQQKLLLLGQPDLGRRRVRHLPHRTHRPVWTGNRHPVWRQHLVCQLCPLPPLSPVPPAKNSQRRFPVPLLCACLCHAPALHRYHPPWPHSVNLPDRRVPAAARHSGSAPHCPSASHIHLRSHYGSLGRLDSGGRQRGKIRHTLCRLLHPLEPISPLERALHQLQLHHLFRTTHPAGLYVVRLEALSRSDRPPPAISLIHDRTIPESPDTGFTLLLLLVRRRNRPSQKQGLPPILVQPYRPHDCLTSHRTPAFGNYNRHHHPE